MAQVLHQCFKHQVPSKKVMKNLIIHDSPKKNVSSEIKPGNFKGGPRPDRTDPGSDPDRRQQLLGGSSRCHRADRPSFAGPVGASQKNPAGRHPVHRSRQSRPQHAPTFDPTSGGKNRHHRFHFGFYHVQMFSDVYCLADYRGGMDIWVAVD